MATALPHKKLHQLRNHLHAKLHRWFDIRQMNVAGRYTFLGIVIIFTVLLFFFLGLAIDFALQQPATMALWGIGLGSVLALAFTWRQL